MTVDSSGTEGLAQVLMLLDVIRDQGEAAKADEPRRHGRMEHRRRPTPDSSHYDKFCQIRKPKPLPDTYRDIPVKDPAAYRPDEHPLEQILIGNFEKFIDVLNGLFAGNNPDDLFPSW